VHFLVTFAIGLAPFIFAGLFGGGNALLLSGAAGELAVYLYFPLRYWFFCAGRLRGFSKGKRYSVWSVFESDISILCGKSQKNHL
jgi:hypothetical protein